MATNRRYGMDTTMLNEFIEYLINQIGQPYLWGGQHTKLTPENYEEIIHKREDGRGKYADGQTYAEASIAYCRKLFNSGATVLYAYDCSGLGMYWLQNLHHIYNDMTADGMMHKCTDLLKSEPPEKGWWCFKQDSRGKATHIGYMVSDTELIEAKGRRFGVTKSKWREKDWSIWGIPLVFEDEIRNPEPQPEPPEPPEPKQFVAVIGKSVRVRQGDGILSKSLGIVHKGDLLPFVDIAPSGWYQIEYNADTAYITSKPKYTELIEL